MISCVLLGPSPPGTDAGVMLGRIVRALCGARLFDIVLVAEEGPDVSAARRLSVTVVAPQHASDLGDLVAGIDRLQPGERSGVLAWPLAAGPRSEKFLVRFFHAFYTSPGRIAAPAAGGFPVILDASLVGELRSSPRGCSLRAFLDERAAQCHTVALDEP